MKLIACRLLQIKIAIDHLERAGKVRYLSNPIVMQITFVREWNFLCMFVFCKISTHIFPYRQYLILLRNILDWMGPYSSIRNFSILNWTFLEHCKSVQFTIKALFPHRVRNRLKTVVQEIIHRHVKYARIIKNRIF